MSQSLPRFLPPNTEYGGYVFDCDGTLVDTMPLHFEAWTQALTEAGAPFAFTWELFVSRAGMTLEQTARELSAQFNYALDARTVADQQRQNYARLMPHVEPIREVVAFADELRRIGKPLAVASGSERAAVTYVLKKVGIYDWFSTIVTPEDVERGKPNPDMFLLAAEQLGCAAQRCLVIEDGEMGFEAARRANMDYVVVQGPRRS